MYGWELPQMLPLGCLKWVEDISQFNKDFLKY